MTAQLCSIRTAGAVPGPIPRELWSTSRRSLLCVFPNTRRPSNCCLLFTRPDDPSRTASFRWCANSTFFMAALRPRRGSGRARLCYARRRSARRSVRVFERPREALLDPYARPSRGSMGPGELPAGRLTNVAHVVAVGPPGPIRPHTNGMVDRPLARPLADTIITSCHVAGFPPIARPRGSPWRPGTFAACSQ